MKLLAVVVFGFVTLTGSEAYYGQKQAQYENANFEYDSSRNQEKDSREIMYQKYVYGENHMGKSSSQYYNKNPVSVNYEYSESTWYVQPHRHLDVESQIGEAAAYQQYGEKGLYRRNPHYDEYLGNLHQLTLGPRSPHSYSELRSESPRVFYAKIAEKMFKFYAIVAKYASDNGTVQTCQAREPLTLRQWIFPMARHQYLTIKDGKLYGLSRGVVEGLYLDTEKNSVDFEYFFDKLSVKGNLKTSAGPKGTFDLNMFNTHVNVSTDLENRRYRNYGHSYSGKTELDYQNVQDGRSFEEYLRNKYVGFVNRALEWEMIECAYGHGGLIGNLISEIESTFDLTWDTDADLVIENRMTQLTVSLSRTQKWNDVQVEKQRKVQFVGFRPSESGNGYKIMVKIVLAKRPEWVSDVIACDGQMHWINVTAVDFYAQNIVATVVMEQTRQSVDGGYKFEVEYAGIRFEGFKYDVGRFGLVRDANEKLTVEIGQHLQEILENGMSAALRHQLNQQQQQIIQNAPMEYVN